MIYKLLRPTRVFILWLINLFYSPYVLGYWSCNDGGGFCVTNKDCTKYRWLGSDKWSEWTNSPGYPRPYNEYLETAHADMISLYTVWTTILKEVLHRQII